MNCNLCDFDYLNNIVDYRIADLFNGMGSLFYGIDDKVLISNDQDQELADFFEKISEIDLPIGTKAYDFVCCPPDVIAYYLKDSNNTKKLEYNCSEINGTGFGGMRNLPKNQLESILDTYKNAAREITDECKKNQNIH